MFVHHQSSFASLIENHQKCFQIRKCRKHFILVNSATMQAILALKSKATGAKAELSATESKWCGWCLQKTEQKLLETRTLRSPTYECLGCQGSTVMCSTLDCEGMSRRWIFGGEDAIDYHESLCLKCQGFYLAGSHFKFLVSLIVLQV